MKRDDIAFQIFLKRLPAEPLTDSNRVWVKSKAEESFELADLFLAAKKGDKEKEGAE